MKKLLSSMSIVASMLVLGACGGGDESAENTEETAETPDTQEEAAGHGGEGNAEQPEMPEPPEPDLEGVPDVVAEVNGTEINKEAFEEAYTGQFQQAAMQQQMAGEEVDQDELKKQVAEGMVTQELFIQEADNREISASEEEVNETLDQLVEQNGMESQDDFFAALEEQGMSEDEARSQLEMQVKTDKLITEEAGDTEPTEEELQTLYDQAKEQQEQMESEQEMPSFEDLRPQLEEQVVMEKEREAVQALSEELRGNSEVTMHL